MPRETIDCDYLTYTDREGFHIEHDIISYSLAAMTKGCRPMMQNTNGSAITMSYLDYESALPNYNIVGVAKGRLDANLRYLAAALGTEAIRVNSISVGPIKTLVSADIGRFKKILDEITQNSPRRRNVTIEQVAG